MPAMIRYLDHWATAAPFIYSEDGSKKRKITRETNDVVLDRALYLRYADTYPAEKVAFSETEGTRRRGRPHTRWSDDVEKDLN
ncbi:hypothetical protein TNCV_181091 [Trichonephila clavipes]|nr:hypothetical protein TNCV_181091 [Trichonephila clavipes]